MKQNGIYYCLCLHMNIDSFFWNCSFPAHSAPCRLAMKQNVLFRTKWRRVFLLRLFSKVLPILGPLFNQSYYLAQEADSFLPPMSSWKYFHGEQCLCSFQFKFQTSTCLDNINNDNNTNDSIITNNNDAEFYLYNNKRGLYYIPVFSP